VGLRAGGEGGAGLVVALPTQLREPAAAHQPVCTPAVCVYRFVEQMLPGDGNTHGCFTENVRRTPPAGPQLLAASYEESVFTQALLDTNRYRQIHQSPPMRWNPELAELAHRRTQALAARARFQQDHGDLVLDSGHRVGQNLYMSTLPGDGPPTLAVLVSAGCDRAAAVPPSLPLISPQGLGFVATRCPGMPYPVLSVLLQATHACAAVKGWYDEEADYLYERPGTGRPGRAVGHFTALVWAESVQLGFAASTVSGVQVEGRSGRTVVFVCCNYLPGGNIVDPALYRRNVLRPTAASATS
jgi:hypothetical protein